MTSPAMVPLTTVSSLMEARVVTARLGADGILAQWRGGDATYVLPRPVQVLVLRGQAEEARQLLLADQVEAVFDDVTGGMPDDG
jgi:hypothetical protein